MTLVEDIQHERRERKPLAEDERWTVSELERGFLDVHPRRAGRDRELHPTTGHSRAVAEREDAGGGLVARHVEGTSQHSLAHHRRLGDVAFRRDAPALLACDGLHALPGDQRDRRGRGTHPDEQLAWRFGRASAAGHPRVHVLRGIAQTFHWRHLPALELGLEPTTSPLHCRAATHLDPAQDVFSLVIVGVGGRRGLE